MNSKRNFLMRCIFAAGAVLAGGGALAQQTWTEAVEASEPAYWWRFEESSVEEEIPNAGSTGSDFNAFYGIDIEDENLGKKSVSTQLGNAIEFTGPAAGSNSEKVIELTLPDDPNGIPELVNFRSGPEDKTTSVEYWIKTSQAGSTGTSTWTSPAVLAHESPSDGDFYWGYITGDGDFGMSTSDIREIFSRRDGNYEVTDGIWHHIVMIKDWNLEGPNLSTLHIDGGALAGGVTIEKETDAGSGSLQDDDSAITLVGKVQNGGGEDHQFIGFLDELVIYDRGLTPEEVAAHFNSVNTDSDDDGLSDRYEEANGLDPNKDDAQGDLDEDGSTNYSEFEAGTDPQNPDSDSDGLMDGVETGTGTWVSAEDRGTDPLNADTDSDSLMDGVENNTGTFVDADNPGTNPLNADTDGDGFSDSGEVKRNTNPNDAESKPEPAADWATQIANDAPNYWYRFEETSVSDGLSNEGSTDGFKGVFSEKFTDADLGKESAFPGLGKAIEFTGPPPSDISSFGEFEFLGEEASFVDFGDPIPELVNLRSDPQVKSTSVEYWIKTSQVASTANQTWNSPAVLSHESGGDGDMYWGWIRGDGDFGLSTSDIREILSERDGNYPVTDGQWHHVLLVKEWPEATELCRSAMYIDGGTIAGGVSLTATTPAGSSSWQDEADGQIRYLGIVEKGVDGNPDVQFIGMLDELVIYDRALDDIDALLHWLAAGGEIPPKIAITREGDTITITFTGVLQSADNVLGTFEPVESAESPYTVPATGTQRFYIAVSASGGGE